MKKNRSIDDDMRNKAMEIYHRFAGFNAFSLPEEYLLAVNFVEVLIEKNREYQVVRDDNTITYFW